MNCVVPAVQQAPTSGCPQELQQTSSCPGSSVQNLLANASDPRKENSVLPVFVVILKELSSKEVRFLDRLLTVIDQADDGSTQASGIFDQTEMEAIYGGGLDSLRALYVSKRYSGCALWHVVECWNGVEKQNGKKKTSARRIQS
jgi:hypothetical protein